MTYTTSLLGRRWKPIILWKIHDGCDTAAALRRAIPLVTRKMLHQELGQLVTDTLITKLPPSIHRGQPNYALTPLGESLLPLLEQMLEWGTSHAPTI